MHITIAPLATVASMATYCAASASGGGATWSPSSFLPIFDQPTTDFSSSCNGMEITDFYADDEDREWYENQYKAIG